MKIVCVVLSIMMDGTSLTREVPFQSISECQAWKHQQEFVGPTPPSLADFLTCKEVWNVQKR